MFQQLGRMLLFFGGLIFVLGALIPLFDKIPYIGRLPGDIYIEKENFSFYAPITSSIIIGIIISLLLTILFNIKK